MICAQLRTKPRTSISRKTCYVKWGFQILYAVEQITGNPGSVIVPKYGSSKITVFIWGKNIILKFLGNTK